VGWQSWLANPDHHKAKHLTERAWLARAFPKKGDLSPAQVPHNLPPKSAQTPWAHGQARSYLCTDLCTCKVSTSAWVPLTPGCN